MSGMQDPFAEAAKTGVRRAHVAGATLADMADNDDRIILLAADLGRGPLGAAFVERYPDRFYDFGIAEANSLSVAAGLAACDFRPYVIEMSCFSALKCAEQIRNDIAFPKLPVRILSSLAGLSLAYFGTSHHAIEDIAITRSITNLVVAAPSDAATTAALMKSTVDHDGPVYFRLMQGGELALYDEEPEITFGRFLMPRQGEALTIVATGLGTQVAVEAADLLAAEGVSVRVLDAVWLKPLDEDAILAAARETGAILTVEEHNVVGGLGTAVGEVLARARVSPRFAIHGLPDQDLAVATPPVLYKHYGLTGEAVAEQARALLRS